MIPFLLFGMLFGYFLSKVGATDFDTVINFFLLTFKTDHQLMGGIGVALAVTAVGLGIIRFMKLKSREGDRLVFESIPFEWNRVAGGLIFGAGWAMTGACPGVTLTQLGEGKLSAIFTLLGILLGTWLYMKYMGDSGSDCE